MRGLLGFIILALLAVAATARDNGQWAQSSPALRNWFKSQKSPATGAYCCDESDGTFAEEDIREGAYWTRCPTDSKCPIKDWMPVPAEVVIHDPNRNGAPVVWWLFQDGKPQIRCYAPGGGV